MSYLNDLTIIIVTYRTNKEILFNCIDSIDSNVKILIVENSSDNEFKSELEKKYSNISVILANKNLGYGAGNNLGFKNIKNNIKDILNPYYTTKKNGTGLGLSIVNKIINDHNGEIDFVSISNGAKIEIKFN